MKELLSNTVYSYKHIAYTFKHYLAFIRLEKQLTGKVTHWHHDWDKLFWFLVTPWRGDAINNSHRKNRSHHPTFWSGDDLIRKHESCIDWEEAVIDWECARITKPDKPLNAYDTMLKYYPEYENSVVPVLKKFNLL